MCLKYVNLIKVNKLKLISLCPLKKRKRNWNSVISIFTKVSMVKIIKCSNVEITFYECVMNNVTIYSTHLTDLPLLCVN